MKKLLLLTVAALVVSALVWSHLDAAEATQPDSQAALAAAAVTPELCPAEQPTEEVEAVLSEDGKIFLSGCDEVCRDQCIAERLACKNACNGNFWCIIECDCAMYYCIEECLGCEQDPPPLLCQ